MANPVSGVLGLTPLAAVLGALLGIAPPHAATAATLLVTDCTDGADSGTLRHTIAAAPDASTIEIPLMCSTITLTQGTIVIGSPKTSLTIAGQGPAATMIDANSRGAPPTYHQAFASGMTGQLHIKDLTIAHAKYTGGTFPQGGCIYAFGDIYLRNTVVTDCRLTPFSGHEISKGAGIYSRGYVLLRDSMVSHNIAANASSSYSLGGGIYAATGILAERSTISDNVAHGSTNPSRGGGIFCLDGGVTLVSSTISGNRADINSAFEGKHKNGVGHLVMDSSTISGNLAYQIQTASAYSYALVFNSTIAFNQAYTSNTYAPAGLYVANDIKAYSSIFAENSAPSVPSNDVFSHAASNAIQGTNLLITATTNSVPLGTLAGCPRLGHLSDNGGPTQTIPLLAGSPAIDTGNADGADYDQRGLGFPRTLGSGTDIGAFERTPGATDDAIFFAGFETRCN